MDNIKDNNRIRMFAAIFIGILLLAFMPDARVFAADLNGAVSSGEATVGDTVTVTVTFSSDVTIGAYDLSLVYDANVLEYISGADGGNGGSVILLNEIVNAGSDTRQVVFKAKQAGNSQVSIVQRGDICDMNGADLSLKVAAGQITVNAPAAASSNNNLAKLDIMAVRTDGTSGSVVLQPLFTGSVTKYDLWLGAEFNKLNLSAAAEDSKAVITTSGTELTAGRKNTTTITVTAEDGSSKSYVITVHVSAPEEHTTEPPVVTTPQGNENDTSKKPDENDTTAPAGEENTTPAGEENTTPAEGGDVIADIGGKQYSVRDLADGISIPEGFESTKVACRGNEYTGAVDLSGNITLLYGVDIDTEEGSFFIYDSSTDTFSPFVQYTVVQRMYIIMPMDDFTYGGVKASENPALELTALSLSGSYADAYRLKSAEGLYIIKARNWDNKIGYYYYNSTDGSMMPMFETAGEKADDKAVEAGANVATETKSDGIKTVLLIISVILCILFLIIIVILAAKIKGDKGRKHNSSKDDDGDDDEYDDYEDYDDDDDDYGDDDDDDGDDDEDEDEDEDDYHTNDTYDNYSVNKADETKQFRRVEPQETESEEEASKLDFNSIDSTIQAIVEAAEKSAAEVEEKSIKNKKSAKAKEELEREAAKAEEELNKKAAKAREELEKKAAKAKEELNKKTPKTEEGTDKEEPKKEEASKEEDEDEETESDMTEQEFESAIDRIFNKLFD